MFATAWSCGVRRAAISLTRAVTAGTSRQSLADLGSGPDHIAPTESSGRRGCSHGHCEFVSPEPGAGAGCPSLSAAVPGAVMPGASLLWANAMLVTVDAMPAVISNRSDRASIVI